MRLAVTSTIITNAPAAKKSIEKASELLGELQNEMQGTLEQLKEELTVGTPIEAGVNR